MKTRISALMDGELEAHECDSTLNALRTDQALREQWQDFQLAGDVLRGEHGIAFDITARVMSALESEPTVLAPRASRGTQWYRPALALAASMAGVAVVGWVAIAPPSGAEIGASAALVAKIKEVAHPLQLAAAPSANARLQEYLLAHQAQAPVGGLEAGTRYVRTVSALREAR